MCNVHEASYTLNFVNPKPLDRQCTDKIDFWLEKKSKQSGAIIYTNFVMAWDHVLVMSCPSVMLRLLKMNIS